MVGGQSSPMFTHFLFKQLNLCRWMKLTPDQQVFKLQVLRSEHPAVVFGRSWVNVSQEHQQRSEFLLKLQITCSVCLASLYGPHRCSQAVTDAHRWSSDLNVTSSNGGFTWILQNLMQRSRRGRPSCFTARCFCIWSKYWRIFNFLSWSCSDYSIQWLVDKLKESQSFCFSLWTESVWRRQQGEMDMLLTVK